MFERVDVVEEGAEGAEEVSFALELERAMLATVEQNSCSRCSFKSRVFGFFGIARNHLDRESSKQTENF